MLLPGSLVTVLCFWVVLRGYKGVALTQEPFWGLVEPQPSLYHVLHESNQEMAVGPKGPCPCLQQTPFQGQRDLFSLSFCAHRRDSHQVGSGWQNRGTQGSLWITCSLLLGPFFLCQLLWTPTSPVLPRRSLPTSFCETVSVPCPPLATRRESDLKNECTLRRSRWRRACMRPPLGLFFVWEDLGGASVLSIAWKS